MPVADVLAKDHRALERLLTSLGETSGNDAEARIELFTQLQALLQAHSRAEEEVVYRRLRAKQPDESKVLEAFEEHHLADILLQELASSCPGGAGWAAKLKVLEETLRLHIREEEIHLFALLGPSFDDVAQARMGREFELVKHERIEAFLAPLRRATPAFAGRAVIGAQAAAGRVLRRGELFMLHRLGQLGA
jgi:hypothetical protein